ncbi:MAG: hypothetical protein Q7R62_02735 [bacterium]|nr:hypothetical protein [bacterium]
MAIKLKSVLKIQKQQLLLTVRALLFASSLWLLADQEFSTFQFFAFILIGAVLYFIPVFKTILILPSFIALMIVSPIAMSVFGPQIQYPSLLAGFFGVLFYLILGIKQMIFVNRAKLHHVLHLALIYCASVLFFAAPSADWFVVRSLFFGVFSYMLVREFLLIQGSERGARVKLISALIAFLLVEAVWVLGLLPLGFINSAGMILIFIFAIEELVVLIERNNLTRRALILELTTFTVLLITIFSFSSWTLS